MKAAHEVRVAAYLTKPVRQEQLVDCLRLVLGQAASRGEAPEAHEIITRHRLAEVRAGSQECVLVVDDNPINQKVAARMLEKMGCRVEVAANGREAVEAVATLSYGLILMDCQMPEMDGFEATREIRRREVLGKGGEGAESEVMGLSRRATHRIPIVAMTANAMSGDREQCLAEGMDDYLSKPVQLQDVQAVLQRWLNRSYSEVRYVRRTLGFVRGSVSWWNGGILLPYVRNGSNMDTLQFEILSFANGFLYSAAVLWRAAMTSGG